MGTPLEKARKGATTESICALLSLAGDVELLVDSERRLQIEVAQLKDTIGSCEEALDAVCAPKRGMHNDYLNVAGRIRNMTTPSYILERKAFFAEQQLNTTLAENERLTRLLSERTSAVSGD